MDKVLTSNAIDSAFYAHVAKRFEALCASGDGSHYEKARVAFEADLRFAQRAHDDVMAQLVAHEAEAAQAARDAEAASFKSETDAKKADDAAKQPDDPARADYDRVAAFDTGEPRSAADVKADARAAKKADRDAAKADS